MKELFEYIWNMPLDQLEQKVIQISSMIGLSMLIGLALACLIIYFFVIKHEKKEKK